ncbi:MAG: glycosyltransferase family 4 protein [Candidatus Omnitrophica bacterium]|nr:glycosyltransferase family 4 protein [Candidatus Omnitrophota bacterium]
MKKILFLTIDFPPMGGGMARHSHDIGIALRRMGADYTVIAPGSAGVSERDDGEGITVYRLKGVADTRIFDNYLKSVFAFFFRGLRHCLSGGVGLIIVNTWSIAGVAAFLIKKITGVPYVVFAHGLDVYAPRTSPKALRLMKLVLKNASVVAANSGFTKTLVEKIEPRAKALVIHPAADPGRFAPDIPRKPKVCEGVKVILTVGRLVGCKNHETVIRAMPEVVRIYPDTVYLIIGEGPEEKALEDLALALGLEDKAVFLSGVKDSELAAYYHSCDIFVLASKEISGQGLVEGFGIVFLEAGLCAKPVIGGRSGGIPDAVLDGVTGILVDPMDEGAIASAIIRLLSDRELAKKMGENGKRRVESEFNLDAFGKKLENVFIRILSAGPLFDD